MVKHLFKLIWNKKKQNALLITEMFISFIVVFAVFTMVVYSYNNYKQPMGMNYEDVWLVNYTPPENINSSDSVAIFLDALKNTLHNMPQISTATFAGNNTPFSMNQSNSSIDYENHKKVMSNVYFADENYLEVLQVQMKSGRWLKKGDEASKIPVIVINAKLAEDLFEGKDPVGKKIGKDNDQLKIIGVVESVKDKGDYQSAENGYFRAIDTGTARWIGNILLKVKPGTDAAFESKLFKTISNAIGTNIEIEHLDKKLVSRNKVMLVPMIIAFVVAAFLIINVALGLFGVLWYNINKRRGEIGLRRAVGASGKSIYTQLVGETLVLTTVSLIVGCFFAVQFPLLNVFDLPAGIYITAILFAILFIYVLATVCALYPGKQAATIYPAVALHED
jgi:putative ABC transport system permease protein